MTDNKLLDSEGMNSSKSFLPFENLTILFYFKLPIYISPFSEIVIPSGKKLSSKYSNCSAFNDFKKEKHKNNKKIYTLKTIIKI